MTGLITVVAISTIVGHGWHAVVPSSTTADDHGDGPHTEITIQGSVGFHVDSALLANNTQCLSGEMECESASHYAPAIGVSANYVNGFTLSGELILGVAPTAHKDLVVPMPLPGLGLSGAFPLEEELVQALLISLRVESHYHEGSFRPVGSFSIGVALPSSLSVGLGLGMWEYPVHDAPAYTYGALATASYTVFRYITFNAGAGYGLPVLREDDEGLPGSITLNLGLEVSYEFKRFDVD